MAGRRLLVVGLDCAAPQLVFEAFRDELPHLRALASGGLWGVLHSCEPPITIPAWMVMMTGRTPGELGLYGFRHRRGPSYTDGWIASSQTVRLPTYADRLGVAGGRVILVGVPPAYPPRPVAGWAISCFLTPGPDSPSTYPASLKDEIARVVPGYRYDVEFRTDDRDRLLTELYDMTDGHFRTVEHLMTTRPWDLLQCVEIGVDRLHHAFWKFWDLAHPAHEPGSRYAHAMRDYYRFVDGWIGRLLERLPERTDVLVVSDHGAKAMRGAFCVNQWLAAEGDLVLARSPEAVVPIEQANVDWARTRAWGWGGYYARIFLNVRGREPQGLIAPADYPRVRAELADRLRAVRDPQGRPMATRVFTPEELYPACEGDPPDLMVYFDDLRWRSAGTIGHPSLYLAENDTGPDDAVHAHEGLYIWHRSGRAIGRRADASIYDVAPSVLRHFGLDAADLPGRGLELD
ncbi:MAG: alkaline phosphatase family protein [Armatimonadota bacterium]|nr:alkaline phosphatase family protein [Armatimonadota bacterium]MDR7423165.1 alkaline phosphatase family protein [Armatimonadota bacterium]MDR7497951.1 alkaline phosphatase family protein [Armatimonadota bacterium]MDR7510594.1 alkaline phosphatase family protein [Armatimonadota bacterium]